MSRRRTLWIACTLLVLVAPATLYLGWTGMRQGWISRRIYEEETVLRSRRVDVPDAGNRFVAARKAAEESRIGKMPLDIWDKKALGDAWPADDRLLREELDRWGRHLDRWEAALDLPSFSLPPDPRDPVFDPEGSFLELRVLTLSRGSALRAWRDFMDGRPEEGRTRLRRLLGAARDWAGADLQGLALAPVLQKDAALVLQDVARRPGLGAGDLRRLAADLRDHLDAFPTPEEAFRSDRLRIFRRVAEKGHLLDESTSTWEDLVARHWTRASLPHYDRLMDRIIEAGARPYPERSRLQDEIDAELQTLWIRKSKEGFLAMIVHPSARLPFETEGQARLAVSAAALRLQAVRLERGAYPASLQELSRIDGGSVPIDPFTGAPLRMLSTPEGARVASVGRGGAEVAIRLSADRSPNDRSRGSGAASIRPGRPERRRRGRGSSSRRRRPR